MKIVELEPQTGGSGLESSKPGCPAGEHLARCIPQEASAPYRAHFTWESAAAKPESV